VGFMQCVILARSYLLLISDALANAPEGMSVDELRNAFGRRRRKTAFQAWM